MEPSDQPDRPTWVIDVPKDQREATAQLVELALSHAVKQDVNLLLVHVMTEVPTSRKSHSFCELAYSCIVELHSSHRCVECSYVVI